jgi:hypothetical protein
VFVNGERVEWSTLQDGDDVMVGCHTLRFIEVAGEQEGDTHAPERSRQLTA